jgi:hypothetical protein
VRLFIYAQRGAVWKQPLGIYLLLFPAITAYFVSVGRERREAILILRKANGDLVCSSAKSQFAQSLIQFRRLAASKRDCSTEAWEGCCKCCAASAWPNPRLLCFPGLRYSCSRTPLGNKNPLTIPSARSPIAAEPDRLLQYGVSTVPAPSPFSGARPDLADHILGTQSLIHSSDSA